MNIFNRVTWKSLWHNRVRTVVTIAGIILSTAMFMAVCTMGISFWDFLVRGTVLDYGDYFARYDYISEEEVNTLAADPRVDSLFDSQTLGYFRKDSETADWSALGVVSAVEADYFTQIGINLTQGRFPQSSSEIVVPEELIYQISSNGIQLGDTIALALHTQVPTPPQGLTQPEANTITQRSFTVVGFSEATRYRMIRDDLDMPSFFVLADGSQGQALWHRAFIQCAPRDARKLIQDYDTSRFILNDSLLNLYGTSGYDNMNALITAFAVILCAIIMLGTISLIYNAFSISVGQRTRQFGLLCSIGATKRQLRRMVFTEALYLCALGIPLGLISGYGGIAITIRLLKEQLDTYLSTNGGAVTLQPVFSPLSLGAAALIALATVLVSSAIPARQATRISPMDAIRQTQEYKTGAKPVRSGWLTRRLFGLSGILAKKYYTISRSKYRATVVSLSISVILFLSAVGFAQSFESTMSSTITVQNYDIECYDCDRMEELRNQSFISRSAYVSTASYRSWVDRDEYSQEARDFKDTMADKDIQYSLYTPSRTCMPHTQLAVYYLEDGVLREYLENNSIDPAPYFQSDPMALVVKAEGTVYLRESEDSVVRYSYSHPLLDESVEFLQVYGNTHPEELADLLPDGVAVYSPYDTFDSSGNPVVELNYYDPLTADDSRLYFSLRREVNEQGQQVIAYYQRATLDGADSPHAAGYDLPLQAPIRLGAVIDELPFGIAVWAYNPESIALLLPMSARPEGPGPENCLLFNVSDHSAAVQWLDAQGAKYVDILGQQESDRTVLTVVRVFSYGFIVLISLIAASNVFNTVSTNISLRRRDFGTLKSVGMTKKAMRRMLVLECLTYGAKALLYGLPLGIGICWAIYRETVYRTTFEDFSPPWSAIAVAAASVFAVVFASMFYASQKLNRQDPIEAIRQENI